MKILGSKIWNLVEKTIYYILVLLFKFVKKELSDDMLLSVMQFVKFGVVGASNTILSYIIYVVSLSVFQVMEILSNSDYLVAQIVAFILSVLWAFYWNNKVVFTLQEGEERSVWKSLIKMFISYSFTGLFLNAILIVLWVQVMHISKFIAPMINLIVSIPINFIINKFWAFRGKK